MDKDIEDLARLMWASWGGSSPDLPWNRLPEVHQFKWKAQAELLISHGYSRHLKQEGLDSLKLHGLAYTCWITDGTRQDFDVAKFIELICSRFGKVTLDEEKVYKVMAEAAEQECGAMTTIGEEITRNQAKAIVSAARKGELT